MTSFHDPVLKSFSLALAHDVLCAWRGIPSTGHKSRDASGSLPVSKELWVFWFHEDPNLQGIVSAELKGELAMLFKQGVIKIQFENTIGDKSVENIVKYRITFCKSVFRVIFQAPSSPIRC